MGTERLPACAVTPEIIREASSRAARSGNRVEVSDEGCAGLEFGVSPAGVKSWSLRVRDPSGRLRRFRVGGPEKTPTAARKAAATLRVQVEAGHDPVAEKRAKRLAGADLRAGIGTLAALLNLYEQQGNPPKTWFSGAGRKRIERVFGRLLTHPVSSMKPSGIVREADSYKGTPLAAANAIRALRPVLTWAARRDYAPSALLSVTPGLGVPERSRVLSPNELKRVLSVLRSGIPPHGLVMVFILLTLARREEAAGVTWPEVDLGASTWTIPPERQKKTRRNQTRKPLVVPLSTAAHRLLHWMKAQTGEPNPDGLIFRGKSGARLGNWDRAQQQIFHSSETDGWHRHDLRRTSATILGDLGVPPHVVEAALNHSTIHSELAGRYNQSRYRADVQDALQKLGSHYELLASRWELVPNLDSEAPTGEPEWVLRPSAFGEVPTSPKVEAPQLPVIYGG
jgi:integrase